jgi:hypothetical protein
MGPNFDHTLDLSVPDRFDDLVDADYAGHVQSDRGDPGDLVPDCVRQDSVQDGAENRRSRLPRQVLGVPVRTPPSGRYGPRSMQK